jgi:hypothetical protein
MNRLCAALILCCVLSAVAPAAVSGDLIDFRVEDQFRKIHTRDEVRGKVFIIVGADRKGSEFTGAWNDAIMTGVREMGVADQVISVVLADLRGLPFFLKGMIRGKFAERSKGWSIMDWKGVFPKAYGFEKDVSNVLVFGPDGRLLHRTSGQEADPVEIRTILKKIEAVLQ